jgi:hypothetical protein
VKADKTDTLEDIVEELQIINLSRKEEGLLSYRGLISYLFVACLARG